MALQIMAAKAVRGQAKRQNEQREVGGLDAARATIDC
jgi:hypothetical protein